MEHYDKSPIRGLGLEICANSIASAIAAEEGGAHRIELCANLAEGGTTPSYGQIKWCVENLQLDVWPLIRPRGGDFLYTDAEFESILEDIAFCKQIGCDGIVTGVLLTNGRIDKLRCAKIIEAAYPMPVAFHRAFDMSNDLSKSLETLIDLGFVRVLTSAGESNANEGKFKIAKLIHLAKDRIEIMPGAGVNATNIVEIAKITGAKSFHTTAKSVVASKMKFKNQVSKMGGSNADEFSHEQTDVIKVKELAALLREL